MRDENTADSMILWKLKQATQSLLSSGPVGFLCHPNWWRPKQIPKIKDIIGRNVLVLTWARMYPTMLNPEKSKFTQGNIALGPLLLLQGIGKSVNRTELWQAIASSVKQVDLQQSWLFDSVFTTTEVSFTAGSLSLLSVSLMQCLSVPISKIVMYKMQYIR